MEEQKPNIFQNLMFIFPVMFYYALEAFLVSLFIMLIWNLTLVHIIGDIKYLQFVAGYWIIKMLLFDVFKLITGLGAANTNIRQDMVDNPEDNKFNEE